MSKKGNFIIFIVILVISTIILYMKCFLQNSYLPLELKDKPIVRIDDWWNTDYAKQSCGQNRDDQLECKQVIEELHEFRAQMDAAFASDALCQNITFISYTGPSSQINQETVAIILASKWTLMLDFMPNNLIQNWSITPGPEGKGDPKEIAHSVCAIVNKKGGTILN